MRRAVLLLARQGHAEFLMEQDSPSSLETEVRLRYPLQRVYGVLLYRRVRSKFQTGGTNRKS